MEIKLSEILSIYKAEQLNEFIKKYSNYDLEEKNLILKDIEQNWSCVGGTEINLSSINILKNPGKGLIERITNAIDAVLEKEKKEYNIQNPQTAEDIVKVAFPQYYKNKKDILEGIQDRQNACETNNKVIVAINDSSKSTRPTIDVIDQGTGINGEKFGDTILSIHKGNKSRTDKNYLIGAFGQGGSTSLPFSYATIIVSKINDHYYFTIVKKYTFEDIKMETYLYLTINGIVPIAYNDLKSNNNYIDNFINSKSGTLIRMIETEIPKEYRDNDVTKPGKLHDYINTELYKVSLPIKVVENRADYQNNEHKQDRNCFGSYYKILTWHKYVKKENYGSISITHNNRDYKINYYIILPEEQEKWAKDSECKNIFAQFNIHLDPIIYTVSGQYITSEGFTKLKNAGLSFLQYRLLVDIDLDKLGKEKYSFFTTDRSGIRDNELTKGFIDKVIKALKNENRIQEINDTIANMSINSTINEDLINNISKNVKNIYNKFLKSTGPIHSSGGGHRYNPTEEEEYLDNINTLIINNEKKKYYKNESISIVLKTEARKSVNEKANINLFLDERQYYDYNVSFLNGRIIYNLSGLKVGEHQIDCELFEEQYENNLKSNIYEFEILDEEKNDNKSIMEKSLDIQIIPVNEKELIIDVIKNEKEKTIKVFICLTHELLKKNIYGRSSSEDEVANIKNKLIEPLALFTLFTEESYDKLEIEEKNKQIIALSNTIYITNIKNNI